MVGNDEQFWDLYVCITHNCTQLCFIYQLLHHCVNASLLLHNVPDQDIYLTERLDTRYALNKLVVFWGSDWAVQEQIKVSVQQLCSISSQNSSQLTT
jgi:hypothetical protein